MRWTDSADVEMTWGYVIGIELTTDATNKYDSNLIEQLDTLSSHRCVDSHSSQTVCFFMGSNPQIWEYVYFKGIRTTINNGSIVNWDFP